MLSPPLSSRTPTESHFARPKKILREQQGLLARALFSSQRLTRLFGAGLLLLSGLGAQAQTTTVFNEDFEGATNSFTPVNGVVLDNLMITAQLSSSINSALPTAGTNFTSFGEAASRLNLDSLSGPVTLTVLGGSYTEQFLLGEVAGTSATNTLVVQLNGTDYTTTNNLNINAPGGGTSGTYGVLLTNAADNDRITTNIINADIATTSSNLAGIVVGGATTSATTRRSPA